jgi:hypothetical protein
LITVENRPGQGGGRKSNLYRLAMDHRQPDADFPARNPEPGSRNAGSGCARETGNPAPGNRKAGAGNRNCASDEPEERNVIGGRIALWEGFLPRWVGWMRRSAPDVSIQSEIGFEEDLMRRLIEGTLDIGLM